MMLISDQFDDVYFSRHDGLKESYHVFLQGNHLPKRWAQSSQPHFTIAETGFGTGLNLLAAWMLFDETATDSQRLHFLSFEQYPLDKTVIREALSPWQSVFGKRLDAYLNAYPDFRGGGCGGGYHRFFPAPHICVTLVVGDVNDTIPECDACVDAWFLDGFTPAKNPQMWSDLLFQNMARLSHAHTTCASFTAAGFVRRGLQAAGFDIQKTKGFAYKADMIQGLYAKGTSAPCYNIQKIAIDGAGLAGTACAFVASSYGITADLYDPNGLATQASGNPAGMVNPRISAKNDFLSNFYSQSFVQFINSLGNHLGQKVGCLHLIEDTIKDKRYRSMSQEWPWPENAAQIVNTDQASDIAGIKIDKDALWLPDSMVAAPHDVCAYWLSKSNSTLHPFSRQKDNIYDAHIDASGANMVARYAKDLPIYPVRGQLTILPENMACLDLRCNLAYGGYITPLHQGQQIVGSTFQKWVEHYNIEIDDHIENINKLQNSIPFFQYLTLNKNIKGRAGLRVASEDHLPVIGRWIPHQEAVPLYLSGAHGSHGMVSSLMAAYMILDDMLNLPRMLPRTTRQSIAPDRFYKRAQRRQGL